MTPDDWIYEEVTRLGREANAKPEGANWQHIFRDVAAKFSVGESTVADVVRDRDAGMRG